MNGVHVRDKVSGFGLLGQDTGEQLVIVQIVDDKEKAFEASVGLGKELDIGLELSQRNVRKFGEQFLSGRMQFKVPFKLNKTIDAHTIFITKYRNSKLILDENLGRNLVVIADLVLVRLTNELDVTGGRSGFAARQNGIPSGHHFNKSQRHSAVPSRFGISGQTTAHFLFQHLHKDSHSFLLIIFEHIISI